MKFKSILFFSAILGLFLTFTSCVKDNEIESESAIEESTILLSNLTSAWYGASLFTDSEALERPFITDTTYIQLTDSRLIWDQLSKTNLSFKLKNSLDREFMVDVEFLNDLDELKFSLQIPVSSGTMEKPVTVETNVAIEIPELRTFMQATKMVCKVSMIANDEQTTSETTGTLELQSDVTFFLGF